MGNEHDVTALHFDLHRHDVITLAVEVEEVEERAFGEQTTSVQTDLAQEYRMVNHLEKTSSIVCAYID